MKILVPEENKSPYVLYHNFNPIWRTLEWNLFKIHINVCKVGMDTSTKVSFFENNFFFYLQYLYKKYI